MSYDDQLVKNQKPTLQWWIQGAPPLTRCILISKNCTQMHYFCTNKFAGAPNPTTNPVPLPPFPYSGSATGPWYNTSNDRGESIVSLCNLLYRYFNCAKFYFIQWRLNFQHSERTCHNYNKA